MHTAACLNAFIERFERIARPLCEHSRNHQDTISQHKAKSRLTLFHKTLSRIGDAPTVPKPLWDKLEVEATLAAVDVAEAGMAVAHAKERQTPVAR